MANLTSNKITWEPPTPSEKRYVEVTITGPEAPATVADIRAVLDAIKMDESKSAIDVDVDAKFSIVARIEVPHEEPAKSTADKVHLFYDITAANDYSFRSHS